MQAATQALTNNALLRWTAYLGIVVVTVIAIFQLGKAELLPLPKLFNGMVISPLSEMWGQPMDLLQILIDGTMAGLMYSLVALGFALIYKASGVFNFAQGIMVVFAVLALINLSKGYDVNLWWLAALVLFMIGAVLLTAKARSAKKKMVGGVSLTSGILLGLIAAIFGLQAVFVLKMNVWLAIPATLAMMVLLAIAIERFVLRPLIGQGELILFMATIGLFFFLEGFSRPSGAAQTSRFRPPPWAYRRARGTSSAAT